MSRALKKGDEFASILDWREPVTVARFSRAAIGTIAVHTIALLIFLFAPVGEIRTIKTGRVEFDPKQSVKLVAPRIVKELTQKAPNKGKITHELDVQSALPGKPAPRRFETPAPAGPANRPPEPSVAPIALPAVDIDVAAPQIAALPNGVPNLPRPPEPKLTLENVTPTPTGVPANPQLKMPTSSAVDVAKLTGKAGGGGGGLVSDGDNGAPGDLRNMQLLSDPQNVDFKPYMLQVLNKVRSQWFAVIPQIARTGRQGMVVLQFSVDKRGQVPKLVIANTSGTVAFDQAAVASVSASNPFPPLPAEYKGTEIRLQLAFSYNMPRGR
jgi:TonB family protein